MSYAPPRVIETDAQLVALADAIEAEHRETEAIQVAREKAGQDAFAPDFIEGTIQPRVRKSWEMRARLASLPALTLEGWRAKARIVRLFSNAPDRDCEVDGDADEAMAWSLACDLLGEASGVVVPGLEGAKA